MGLIFLPKYGNYTDAFGVSASSFFIPFLQKGVMQMPFAQYNPNPESNLVGDCVIRAVACATKTDWDSAYIALALQGFVMKDMPSSNHVWGSFLRGIGFVRNSVSNDCPECYTVRDFANEHPTGTYVLGTGSHVVTVIDGCWFDAWDSGDEAPVYFWERSESNV